MTTLGVWRWALDLANVLAGSATAEVDIIFPRGTPWEKHNGTWKSHLGKRNEQLAQPKNKNDAKGTKKSLNRGSMRFLWFHFQKKYFERNHHSFSFWGWVLYSSRTITMASHENLDIGSPPWAAAHSQRHALRSHQTAANGHWSPPCGSWQRSHCMEITVSPPTQKEKSQNTRWDGKMSV